MAAAPGHGESPSSPTPISSHRHQPVSESTPAAMTSRPVTISRCRTQRNAARGSALDVGGRTAENRRRAMLGLYPSSGRVDRDVAG
jgi:hypothetical protein